MPQLPPINLKDGIIAALAGLVLLLVVNTYVSLSLGPISFEGWKPKAQRVAGDLVTEKLQHQVTSRSVETLEGEIAKLNQQARDRAEAYQVSLRQAARDEEKFRIMAENSRRRAERLQTLINQAGPTCEAPPAILDALEGL